MENSNSFVAMVEYVQPEIEELECRYLSIVTLLCSSIGRFTPIKSCKHVSNESREVTFEHFVMNNIVVPTIDDVFIQMKCKGLRPALYEELLGFDKKYPNERHGHPTIALGSCTDLDHGSYFATQYLYGLTVVRYRPMNIGWRYLAVRE